MIAAILTSSFRDACASAPGGLAVARVVNETRSER